MDYIIHIIHIRFYKYICLFEGVELTDIEEFQMGSLKATDDVIGTDLQVEIHNGETVRPILHQGSQGRMKYMNAGKGQRTALTTFHLTSFDILPAYQSHIVVELQIALRLALTHHNNGFHGFHGCSEIRCLR